MTEAHPAFSRKAGSSTRPLSFSDLAGWEQDTLEEAWACFEVSRQRTHTQIIREPGETAKRCLERQFHLVVVGEGVAQFTGYYEPELEASREQTDAFRYPIYAPPPDLTHPWYTRAEIENSGVLRGRGLEIAWLRDAIDVFFLQVQGSGRLSFNDGSSLRVGFAAKNGHPYASIGAELVRRGEISADAITADAVKGWLRVNGTDLLNHNPSFVFFRALDLPESSGPLGAMGLPVTADRSIAVDPEHIPLGTPVWTEIDGIGRLRIAQDIGSAIKGPNRADVFCGTGSDAGKRAGRLNTNGFLALLLPKWNAK